MVPNPPIMPELRELCKAKLLTSLADLMNRAPQSKATSEEPTSRPIRTAGTAEDGEFWLAKVLSIIEDLEKDKKHVELVSDTKDGETDVHEIIELARKLHKVKFLRVRRMTFA